MKKPKENKNHNFGKILETNNSKCNVENIGHKKLERFANSSMQQIGRKTQSSTALAAKQEKPLTSQKILLSDTSMMQQHFKTIQRNIANIYQTMGQTNVDKNEFKAALQTLRLLLGSGHAAEIHYNAEIACEKLIDMFMLNFDLQRKVSELQMQLNRKTFRLETLQRQYDVTKLNFEDHLESARLDTIKQQETLDPKVHPKQKIRNLQEQLTDLRNKNITLTTKMEHAEQALKQEIGPEFDLLAWMLKTDEVAADQTNTWRGRSAEVQRLKQEEVKLIERCKQLQKANANAQLHAVSVLKAEKEITQKYRDKTEDLQRENSALQAQVRLANNKIARFKAQLKVFSDREQRVMVPNAVKERQLSHKERKEFQIQLCKVEQDKLKAKYSERKKQDKIRELKNLLDERERELQELRIRVVTAEDDLKAITGGFLFSCRNIKYHEFIAFLKGLEHQNQDIVKYSHILKERLSTERHKNEELLKQLAMQGKRLTSLQEKVEELQQKYCDYLVKSTTSNAIELMMQKRNQMLEQQALTAEKYKYAYELSQEQNKMLQERIHFLQIEKEMDAKAYECSVLNSKNILLDVLKSRKHVHHNANSQVFRFGDNVRLINYPIDSKV